MGGDKLKIIQINLNKSPYASDNLRNIFKNENFGIACIQEPKASLNKISKLSMGKIYYKTDGRNRPRACIVFRKDLDFLPFEEFCTPDIVACSINVKIGTSKQKLIICSAYLAGENEEVPRQLEDIVKKCKKENRELIYCCDANAHNVCWATLKLTKEEKHC